VRRVLVPLCLLLAGACKRSAPLESVASSGVSACFEDATVAFPHVVRPELKACRAAAECAIEYLRLDRCGSVMAVGVRAGSVRDVDTCAARAATSVVGCPAEPARDERGGNASVSGGFQVECVDGECQTYFRAGNTPPGTRAGLGPDWSRAQRETLNHYAWVDRDAGIVQIPIDRAMDVLVDRSAQ
jgi:hypothetical protein